MDREAWRAAVHRVTKIQTQLSDWAETEVNKQCAEDLETDRTLSSRPTLGQVNSVQFSSVAQSCLTLCNPMNCSTAGLLVHHQLSEFIQTHVHWVGDVIQPSHLCRPLLLPPSIFPSIRVFSNESALCIRWPKYWSFSFSIIPSNEYSGLISFRIDWFNLQAVQGTLKSLPAPQFKSINSSVLSFLYGPTFPSIHDYWKNYNFD